MGNTGARANWLENFFVELCHAASAEERNPIEAGVAARRSMTATRFLSADVTAAFDPNFPEDIRAAEYGVLRDGNCI